MAADETTNAQAEYDLRKGGTQEFAVQDDDGTIIYVTITEEPGKLRANNGTYNLKYKIRSISNMLLNYVGNMDYETSLVIFINRHLSAFLKPVQFLASFPVKWFR